MNMESGLSMFSALLCERASGKKTTVLQSTGNGVGRLIRQFTVQG